MDGFGCEVAFLTVEQLSYNAEGNTPSRIL